MFTFSHERELFSTFKIALSRSEFKCETHLRTQSSCLFSSLTPYFVVSWGQTGDNRRARRKSDQELREKPRLLHGNRNFSARMLTGLSEFRNPSTNREINSCLPAPNSATEALQPNRTNSLPVMCTLPPLWDPQNAHRHSQSAVLEYGMCLPFTARWGSVPECYFRHFLDLFSS